MSDLALSQGNSIAAKSIMPRQDVPERGDFNISKYDIDPRYKKTVTLPNGDVVRVQNFVRNLGEPEKKVRDLGNGYYEVVSRPVVYGAQWQSQIMDEKMLVAAFGSIPTSILNKEGKGEKLNIVA